MSDKMKSYQIIYEQTVKERIISFAVADTKEEAIEQMENDNDLFYSKEVLDCEGSVIEINEMECSIKMEEENEFIKNYPKKEQRPLD